MPRPPKYATAKEAAEHNLYSKMGGASMGLSLFHFILKATSRCEICGCKPSELLTVSRLDDRYELRWNYVRPTNWITTEGYQVTCGTCKKLALMFDIDYIVKHAARIMAKRMHDKRKGIVIPKPGITLSERSSEKDTT